jgi:hypothetical protein
VATSSESRLRIMAEKIMLGVGAAGSERCKPAKVPNSFEYAVKRDKVAGNGRILRMWSAPIEDVGKRCNSRTSASRGNKKAAVAMSCSRWIRNTTG